MQRFHDRTVLITGASSGIGAALAHECAAQGARLVLLARRLELLEALARSLRLTGATVHVYRCDVTDETQLPAVVADLARQDIVLDMVVANAGFGVVGRFDALSLADYQRQFDTNVFGVIRTAYATLEMLRRSRGSLVIMGSITGYIAQPGASAYAMSKFAVRALAESLRIELGPEGIAVTLISPGVIESNLRRVDNRGVFHPHAREPFPAWLRTPAQTAARRMVRAIHARKAEQVITLHGWLAVFMARHLPWILRQMLKRGLQARPQARADDSAS
ncbi:MAG: SDR family NAD(P)-dependent oxidoreductase [Steroidobacteraceae bacterium]